jgi:asparagine synthase (glutamine-hydrolysing)
MLSRSLRIIWLLVICVSYCVDPWIGVSQTVVIWQGTLYGTVMFAIRLYTRHRGSHSVIPPWLSDSLTNRCRQIGRVRERESPSRFGIAPHRLDNANACNSVMETLPHLFPQILSRLEYRYPFLDKDLVSFLFSIPREQIVRPGRRRSLMRRALVGIVPDGILERRRKAFQLRAPLAALQHARPALERLLADSELAKASLIDIQTLRLALGHVAEGQVQWHQALLKTIAFELWLTTHNRRNARLLQRTDASHPLNTLTV